MLKLSDGGYEEIPCIPYLLSSFEYDWKFPILKIFVLMSLLVRDALEKIYR